MQSKIKQQQIVTEFFGFITHLMIKNSIVNPLDVRISLMEFEEYLNTKLGTELKSIQHIYQQIRAYERTHFIKLCKRLPRTTHDIVLALIDDTTYLSKSFLHVGLKLALAHGLHDLISHLYAKEQQIRALNIYFSAGTESLYLAQRLLESYKYKLNIYTHNLGIIQDYLSKYLHLQNIHLYTRFGKVHKETYTILEGSDDLYAKTHFDIIVGSAGYISKNGLYIDSEEEHVYKKEAYNILQGLRVLVLTLFEFISGPSLMQYKYANIDDFHYIIIPSKNLIHNSRTHIESFSFESIIRYYTYEVLKRIS